VIAAPPTTAADLLGSAVAVRLPLRVPFRGLVAREVMLLPGPAGWAEFSPFAEYSAATCRPWWLSAREAALDGWPPPVRERVPVNATVPAVAADEVAGVLALWSGATTAKVKVADAGGSVADDLDRLAAVRDSLGPGGRVRIDVNGAWDLGTAVRLLPAYDRAADGLEYAEQPCAAVDDLAALRRRVDVPVAADESVRLTADPEAVARLGAADVVVLKVAPLGGVRAALQVAERLGLPVVVSSALDSSVGLAAGVALAAALPDLPYACGLGTAALLAADVTDEPLLPHEGTVPVRPVEVSAERLAALALDREQSRAWRSRLARTMREAGGPR
jgi:O-succinylbenzoate synthase